MEKRSQHMKKNPKIEQLRIQNILKMHSTTTRSTESTADHQGNEQKSTVESSPRKRQLNNSSNQPDESQSPSKKFKQQLHAQNSPKPRSLLNTFSSTPQRNKHKPSFENLCKKDSVDDGASAEPHQQGKNDSMSSSVYLCDDEKIERNLSKSWIDIMEDLEEQSTELKEYIEKVKLKYKKTDEELADNIENKAETLKKRQKQINYGKVTTEYKRYISQVPRTTREAYHPRTPNKFRKCSRRKFDGLIKQWRKLLHVWDQNPEKLKHYKHDEELDEEDDCEDFTVDDDIHFIEFYESFSSLNSNDTNAKNENNKENDIKDSVLGFEIV